MIHSCSQSSGTSSPLILINIVNYFQTQTTKILTVQGHKAHKKRKIYFIGIFYVLCRPHLKKKSLISMWLVLLNAFIMDYLLYK